MSNLCLNLVFGLDTDYPVDSNELLLLIAIADQCNDQGFCWPKRETLRRKVKLKSIQSISRINKRLVTKGLLTVLERKHPERGNCSNVYKLNLSELKANQAPEPSANEADEMIRLIMSGEFGDDLAGAFSDGGDLKAPPSGIESTPGGDSKALGGVIEKHPGGVQPATPPGTGEHPPSDAVGAHRTLIEPPQNPQGENLAASGEAATSYKTAKGKQLKGNNLRVFEVFWECFGLKNGKAAAADAFLAAPWGDAEANRALITDLIIGAAIENRTHELGLAAADSRKWAQGWITERRWENETLTLPAEVIRFITDDLVEQLKSTQTPQEVASGVVELVAAATSDHSKGGKPATKETRERVSAAVMNIHDTSW